MSKEKHNFRREKGFQYIVISKCTKCDIRREKHSDGSYTYGDIGSNNFTDPGCIPIEEPNTVN